MKYLLNNVFSFIVTGFVYVVGGIDISLKCLLIVMVIDYISGVASAIYNKKVNSKIGFKGILKKLVYILAIGLAVRVDTLTGNSGIIRSIVIYFFVANDGISIIENMGEMGIKLPKKLTDVLEQLKNKGDDKK